MMNPLIESLLGFADQASLHLLVWSWQAVVLLASVWAGLKLFRVKVPWLRQQIWMIGLLAVLTLPLWPRLLPISASSQQQPWKESPLSYAAELPRMVIVPAVEARLPVAPHYEAGSAAPKRDWLSKILPGAFCLWFAGALLALLGSARGYRRLRRASRRARPTTAEEMGIGLEFPRSVSLNLSAEVRSPVLVGLWHPVILLPDDLAEWTSVEEREAMIAHELAHLARLDHYTNLLPIALKVIFFFHPLVRYGCRQFCLEREMACDDRVIDHGTDAAMYAESLVKAAERGVKGKLEDLASDSLRQPAFFTSKQTLERRIEMVLNTDRVRVLARGWRYLILPAVLIFTLAVLLVPDRPANAQQLQKQLDDAASSVKDGSLKELLSKYMADTAAYDNLVKTVLSQSDGQLREQALRQLVESPQEWATAALGEIYDKTRDPGLRSSLIGHLGQQRASSKLLDLAIKEPNTELRQQAVQRLLEMEGDDRAGALIELYASVHERAVRESIIRRLGQRGDIRGLAIVGDIEKGGTNDPALLQLNGQQLKWMATNHESSDTRRKALEWLEMRRRQASGRDRNSKDDPPPPPPPPPQPSPVSLNDSAVVATMLQQDPSDDNIVKALMRESIDAYFRRDTDFFERTYADDYQGIGVFGEILTKGQVIAEIKHPRMKVTKFEIDDLRLKGEGNSMLATYIGTAYYEEDGKEKILRLRYTDNLVKRRGIWQWIGGHATLMR
jgi:beta-lactamase regulating signal transducer with metallopeptidase domain